MPKTYCTVNENCTNAVDVADGERWRLCDGDGPGSCNPRKGRLEVEYQGVWGTVCDDSFYGAIGTINMNIACRMFGYMGGADSLADDYNRAYFGEGVGTIWLDEVYCTGTETLLSSCQNMGWGNNDCGHLEDQGIVCN
ncbi:scavenger receptor cysteine-rich type 1 protein M160-like [Mya arenaria]|nr:scavenger receptor cysteine-rich type 1 protein M160-like [Mya arenaria]